MPDIGEIEAETIAALHQYMAAMIQRALNAQPEPEPSPWYHLSDSDIGETAANFLWQLQRLIGHRISVALLAKPPTDPPPGLPPLTV
jgi:hypothetical protein